MVSIVTNKSDDIIFDNVVFFHENCEDSVINDIKIHDIVVKYDSGMYDITNRLTDISISVKVLINILCYPDLVFDISYCSWDIIKIILKLDNANIYINYPYFILDIIDKEYLVDGKTIKGTSGLVNYLIERFK